ncbi:MAG: NADH-quinone oxidoreductase subunit NuoH [Ignavibacteriales bacterium]|nr:NADH-quinone oxidoreductase subunit NuoH [Ignavibacteriales bacterium]
MDTTFVLLSIAKIAVVWGGVLTGAAILVLAERRISAWIQNRLGPNRVGPFGLLQSAADVVKLLFKEDIVPTAANRFVHDFAPMISITVALTTFAVIPFGDTIEAFGQNVKLIVADVNIGMLYILALTGIGVYGITLAGWSSNNKYSLLGGLRSSAQLISYELSMGLSIIGVIMISGTLRLDEVVMHQTAPLAHSMQKLPSWLQWLIPVAGWLPSWNVFFQPIGFITFVVASFAETNRLPFDLPEAEPELVGGYHTEYTGMKFGLFFLSEYANMITSSALITTLFLGGWHLPFAESWGLSPFALSLVKIGTFFVKVTILVVFYIIVRWTLPRFRYDQLMRLGWKVMLPLSIANILATGLLLLWWS